MVKEEKKQVIQDQINGQVSSFELFQLREGNIKIHTTVRILREENSTFE